eukprot:NODE_18861_length_872_cov_2.381208.p2 GENE.NODE_18861_length_872_cov_2.381208~~NODE_18861_length_872_cov_2.381208.p2  ORF type:complete len:200 (+),score=62.97 NODE_18861_length_872_cov_2.381208:69-602(+)
MASKVEYAEHGDVCKAVAAVRDGLSVKADRQHVHDVTRTVERVQLEVGQKAEASVFHDVHKKLENLRQANDGKADSDIVTNHLEEVGRRFENVVEQLRQKADQAHLEDTTATVQILAAGLGTPRGAQTALHLSPNSSASSITVGSGALGNSPRHTPTAGRGCSRSVPRRVQRHLCTQ